MIGTMMGIGDTGTIAGSTTTIIPAAMTMTMIIMATGMIECRGCSPWP